MGFDFFEFFVFYCCNTLSSFILLVSVMKLTLFKFGNNNVIGGEIDQSLRNCTIFDNFWHFSTTGDVVFVRFGIILINEMFFFMKCSFLTFKDVIFFARWIQPIKNVGQKIVDCGSPDIPYFYCICKELYIFREYKDIARISPYRIRVVQHNKI
jgi:hypothetical protein